MASRYQLLSIEPNAQVGDPGGVFLAMNPGETSQQAANRKTANNALATLASLPGPAGNSLRVTYNPTTKALDLESVTPAGYTARIKLNCASQTLVFQSSGNQALSPNTYYVPGLLSGQGVWNNEWSFRATGATGSGIPAAEISATIELTNTSTNVKTEWEVKFIPFLAFRVKLYGDAASNASGSASGSSSGSGSASGSASGTASGSASGSTDVDAAGFLIYSDEGWSGADMKFIQNNTIKAGFKRTVGASLCYLAELSNGRNLMNDMQVTLNGSKFNGDPRQGTTISEKGRQGVGGVDYCSPAPGPNKGYIIGSYVNGVLVMKNTKDGYTDPSGAQSVFNTGCNGVPGGSLYPAMTESLVIKSRVINHPTKGQVFCSRVRAAIWGVAGELGHIIYDQEVWLEGIALAYQGRHIVYDREHFGQVVPEQRTWDSQEQENGFAYVLALFTNHLAKVNGQLLQRFPVNYQTERFSTVVYTDDCRVGAFEGGGVGITGYWPGKAGRYPAQAPVATGHFTDVFGDSTTDAASYIKSAMRKNYDNLSQSEVQTYMDGGYFIVGTYQQASDKIATLPAILQDFDFDFSKDNHCWNNSNCRVIREQPDCLSVYIGDVNQDGGHFGAFLSPTCAWQASGIQNIRFDIDAQNVSKLWLQWKKPGGENDDSTRFRKAIDIPAGRNQIMVSTAHSDWNGIISNVSLVAIRDGENNGNPTTQTNAFFKAYSCKKV